MEKIKQQDDFQDTHNEKTTKALASLPTKAIVHPQVLLSVVDHYTRISKGNDRRVCGVLLGYHTSQGVEITNSYAVPFEEDPKNQRVWFFDHAYHETMYNMFKKVNTKEVVVGWYSTGPLLKPNDLDLHEIIRNYCNQPIFAIINVQNKDIEESPVKTFCSIPCVPTLQNAGDQANAVSNKMLEATNAFIHIPSEVCTDETEEVGVEHLLREIRDKITSTDTSSSIKAITKGLHQLKKRLSMIYEYLENILSNRIPPNTQILDQIQMALALYPSIFDGEFKQAFHGQINDLLFMIYVISLLRSTLALHDLIDNRFLNRTAEKSHADKMACIQALKQFSDDDTTNLGPSPDDSYDPNEIYDELSF